MEAPGTSKCNEWDIKVSFDADGALRATATGVLLVPPQDALAFVTDAAGDKLFRVVERKQLADSSDGSSRVEVVNKAAIRVLAWKLWSTSRVVYEIDRGAAFVECQQKHGSSMPGLLQSSFVREQPCEKRVTFELVSSSMLQSLSGTWCLQPLRLHYTTLPQNLLTQPPPPPAAAASCGQGRRSQMASLQCSKPCGFTSHFSLGALLSPRSRARTTDFTWAPLTSSTATSSSHSSSKESEQQLLSSPGDHKAAADFPAAKTAAAPADVKPTAVPSSQGVRPVVHITARTDSNFSGSIAGALAGISILPASRCSSGVGDIACCASSGKGVAAGGPVLPPGLVADRDGFVTATFVHYEQLAQPKGMPPGVRFVPGLSDAVAASVGKEVRQMLDKVSCVADVVVRQGLGAPEALSYVVQQMDLAGGSFKKLQKQLRKQQHIQPTLALDPVRTAALASSAAQGRSAAGLMTLLCDDGAAATTTSSAVLHLLDGIGVFPEPRACEAAGVKQLMSHPVVLVDQEELDD